MSPEETQQLVSTLLEALQSTDIESSNGYIYLLVSIIPSLFILAGYFKKAFVKAIDKVVTDHVKQMEDMFKIMEMHIDELKYVKKEQEIMKDEIDYIKVDVKKHDSWIQKLKDKC